MTTTMPDAPTTVIDVDGVATTVRRSGSGRAVLYLHGAFFPTRWLPFHEAMALHCDLIAPLHPGYAEGGPPDWLRGFDDLVLHYRSLLDALDLHQVDLIGYDLGGWIGAQLAAFHPERVRSFCVLAPSGLRIPEAPMFEFLCADPTRLEQALFNGAAGEHSYLLAPADDIDAFTEAYGENGVTARLIWERRYDVGLERRIRRITAASLVITPEDDQLIPTIHAHRWAELIPNARLETVKGIGHAMVVQAPEQLADLISSFLAEVPE